MARDVKLRAVPLTLAQANEVVKKWHRHHKPVVGCRFSLGVVASSGIVGACIIGRPVARSVEQYSICEVTRLVTDGTPNACSFLYSRAARIAQEMGFQKIQTYILESEPGTSLKAAGWVYEASTTGGDWNRPSRGGRRTDQPQVPKQRWGRILSEQCSIDVEASITQIPDHASELPEVASDGRGEAIQTSLLLLD